MLKKPTVVWVILVLATLVSWMIGRGFGFEDRHRYASAAVMVIAFIKIRLVYLDFMELQTAPLPLRLIFDSWALLVCGTIIVLCSMNGIHGGGF